MALASAAVAIGVACSQAQVREVPTRSPARVFPDRLAAESLGVASASDSVYVRRMLDLIRRARAVPTDSLARLYAAIPQTPDSTLYVLRQEIGCEGVRLAVAHGSAALGRAMGRMRDSLMHSGIDADYQADRMLKAPGPLRQFGPGICGVTLPIRRLPDSLELEPPGPRH